MPGDIDCFIVCTVTPDYYFPATACLVAARLGAKDKPAFDISIACSGFIYGLTVAISPGAFRRLRRVMLIGAETLSKILNNEDRSTAILFGDGAGAVILEAVCGRFVPCRPNSAPTAAVRRCCTFMASGSRNPDRSCGAGRDSAI